MTHGRLISTAMTLLFVPMAIAVPAPGASQEIDLRAMPPYTRWTTIDKASGLPSDKVLCVRADGSRVWAGTEHGLALIEDGRVVRSYGRAQGLPNEVVLALDVSPRTGDLWIGTMGGLARLSGGRIDAFTQLNSGLSNDFVNAVACDPDADQVWAATAMGACRLDLRTGTFDIFTEQNTPMAEPWTYSVAIGGGRVWIGAWGAGVLELDKASGRWREYRDPDKEMEIDLLPDDGPVHDVTAGVACAEGLMWQATYFGLARYDGRAWKSYFAGTSGLASDFIQFVRARGRVAWLCTDRGLSATDGTHWVTYRRREDGKGEITYADGAEVTGTGLTGTALAQSFVLGVDWEGDAIWVATEKGLCRGEPAGSPEVAKAPSPAAPGATPNAEPASKAARLHYARTPDDLVPYRNLPIHRDFYRSKPAFHGASAETPDPDVDKVRIGFIGPLEAQDKPVLPRGARPATQGDPKAALFGRPMLHAAEMAIEDANRAGGYHGIPFTLVPHTDLVQWGQTSNELVRFSYDERVWAIVGGIDSNHQHVMARASLKAEVPICNAGSGDPTLTEHAIPWILRVTSDDRQGAYALLDQIFRVRKLLRVALLRTNDRDGRVGIAEFVQGARRLGHPVLIEQRFLPGAEGFSAELDRIVAARPDALVIHANPKEGGLIVRQARAHGMTVPIFAFDRCTHPAFIDTAGPAAEGVVMAATMNPDRDDAAWLDFRRRYQAREGREPTAWAAHAYDAVQLIVSTIRAVGLNRARIRDALFALDRYEGVAGLIDFDATQNDVGAPWLAEVKGGRLRYSAASTGGGQAPALQP